MFGLSIFSRRKAIQTNRRVANKPSVGSALDAAQVFRPASYPSLTFVERRVPEVQRLRTALTGGGQVICISGASKVGKTVLCQHLIGEQQLLRIPGAQVVDYDQFIGLVAAPLGLSAELVKRRLLGGKKGVSKSVKGAAAAAIPGAIKTSLEGQVGAESSIETEEEETITIKAYLEHEVFQKLSESDRYLLIDDFHRVPENVQRRIMNSAKDYLVSGKFRLILASIPSQAFAPILQNPEMIGRYVHIAIPPWSTAELCEIAEVGFSKLGVPLTSAALRQMAKYAYGNPLLMQAMCLEYAANTRQGTQRASNVDISLVKLVNSYAPPFEALTETAQGKSWKLVQSNKTVSLAKLVFLAISEYPWNQTLSISKSIVPTAKKLAAHSDSIKPADVLNAIRHMIERYNRVAHNSPTLPFELDPTGSNLVVRDPYFRFYLQWSLRTKLGYPVKQTEQPQTIPEDGSPVGNA